MTHVAGDRERIVPAHGPLGDMVPLCSAGRDGPCKGAGATPVLTCLSLCSATEAYGLPKDTPSPTGVISSTGVISGISLCESSPTQISGKDHEGHFLSPYQTLYYNAPK